MKTVTKPDSSALVRLLRERHPLPKWAFFPELRNSNGFVKNPRTIDAAAFNTWPSGRGLRVAYEVKVTRHDYARELDQPDKRAWAESHFPQCYFVAPHGLIDPTTLPDGWGLLEATKDLGKLRAKKLAPPRKVADLPYSGLLVLLRRACDQLHQEREQTFYLNRREVGRKDLQEIVRKRVAHHQERLDEATKDFQNRARALLKTARAVGLPGAARRPLQPGRLLSRRRRDVSTPERGARAEVQAAHDPPCPRGPDGASFRNGGTG